MKTPAHCGELMSYHKLNDSYHCVVCPFQAIATYFPQDKLPLSRWEQRAARLRAANFQLEEILEWRRPDGFVLRDEFVEAASDEEFARRLDEV